MRGQRSDVNHTVLLDHSESSTKGGGPRLVAEAAGPAVAVGGAGAGAGAGRGGAGRDTARSARPQRQFRTP